MQVNQTLVKGGDSHNYILYCTYHKLGIIFRAVNSGTSYNKHVCVCACVRVCVCACVYNGRSPEVIRPLAKYYCFLWAMAIVGHRKGAQ